MYEGFKFIVDSIKENDVTPERKVVTPPPLDLILPKMLMVLLMI